MLNRNLDTARQYFFDGKVAAAISHLEKLENASQGQPLLLQQIAELYIQCGQHLKAGRCYQRAVDLDPVNPDYLYNLATSKIALGDIKEAEILFEKVIQINPGDHGAWLNRSGLKRQTRESNHVEALKTLKAQFSTQDPGQVQICYALAKEMEDLGLYADSFRMLQEGAHRRRQQMQYDVQAEEQAMAMIANRFDPSLFTGTPSSHRTKRPVFILGLPRSGSTLIDRILSSHSQVGSLGEHNTFAMTLMNLVRKSETMGQHTSGKSDLISASTGVDFAELGKRYSSAINGFGDVSARLIDKTPLNFLYLGLIHLALPEAKIIHVRRHPMDICYAIYKTLFRAGYPFSYSLQETGRYYLAYHRLMEHWSKVIPGAYLDVGYENLIAGQERETRRMIDYLGLEWEESCLNFHRHTGPAATASATQVRQPLYSTSVGLWRRYASQLAPLAGKLQENGINID